MGGYSAIRALIDGKIERRELLKRIAIGLSLILAGAFAAEKSVESVGGGETDDSWAGDYRGV